MTLRDVVFDLILSVYKHLRHLCPCFSHWPVDRGLSLMAELAAKSHEYFSKCCWKGLTQVPLSAWHFCCCFNYLIRTRWREVNKLVLRGAGGDTCCWCLHTSPRVTMRAASGRLIQAIHVFRRFNWIMLFDHWLFDRTWLENVLLRKTWDVWLWIQNNLSAPEVWCR